MTRIRKAMLTITMGLVVMALVAGMGFSIVSTPASAQTTAPATTKPAKNDPAAMTELRTNFIKNFAAQLGVDEAKLNSAFTGALGTTIDQAVKDGKLTQAQADRIKEMSKNGIAAGGFLGHMGGSKDGGRGHMGGDIMAGLGATIDAAAKALGLTKDELMTELKAGKSIADVATAKKVDIATVKTAMLAAVKTQLDEAVKNSKLTQAQADTAYQAATTRIDEAVTKTGGLHGGPKGREGGKGHK